ncbi:aspartate aminotransferase [Brevibacterium sandarakinum]|uniref:Aspartate aminotransferase n=1 Tax=Brevibacterium sandarakinum TaxID=629680 RepID=A0A1H1X643_BRESA|nr:pyridoxal phosphate-dependent aminotransferase [Brevibacterium sandarakinum]SDT04541.1 aspartate aminotransferase [Brevibacterium sandarakinum]
MEQSAFTIPVTPPGSSALTERITQVSRRPSNLGQLMPGVVSLAMGEPNADTAPEIVASAVGSLESGRTHYAPLSGLPDLKVALAERISATTGRNTSADEVVLTHGASAALAAVTLALVESGDKVVVPEPTYSLYADQLAMVGAEIVNVPALEDGSNDLASIGEALRGARMLILCNPSNPTGAVMDGEDMAHLETLLTDNPETVLVADEAYSGLVFDDEEFVSALSLTSLRGRTIIIGTFSKTYAMTGWRLGYSVAPVNIAKRIDLVHRTINGALNTFVQDAAVTALETPQHVLSKMRDDYQRRRDLVIDALSSMPKVSVNAPRGAFYAFPKIHSSLTSEQLVEEFAKGGVLVRAGSEYGASGEGHVRISFAADEASIEEGLRRFGQVLEGLSA